MIQQLKFYALGHVLTIVFDVAAPPSDALKPTATPPAGTWLAYLSGVASRAGYPSSDSPALTHKMRETLAWTGVGHGCSTSERSRRAVGHCRPRARRARRAGKIRFARSRPPRSEQVVNRSDLFFPWPLLCSLADANLN